MSRRSLVTAADAESRGGIRTPGAGLRRAGVLALSGMLAPPSIAGLAASISAPAADLVPLAPGLAYTVTSHAGLRSSRGYVPIADTEIVYSVKSVDASQVALQFALSAGRGTDAAKLLEQEPTRFDRQVRREDLRSAARESVLFDSNDPTLMPGQTFATTSAAVLAELHDAGKIAFVLGVNEPEDGLEGLAAAADALASGGSRSEGSASPLVVSGVAMLLGSSARHYYRGTLARVGVEPFSVLLDGKRTTVPAMHARGELRFRDRTITADMWWLDDANDPLTLKWAIGPFYELVTRIDRPPPETGGGAEAGGGRMAAASTVAAGLAGKSCRAELAGVYFTTGSARVLDASMPALRRFAALLAQHPDWQVTIEGHTDNIGSAEYNLTLSTRRAEAVRQVLIGRFGVPAARIRSKGYGLTRPVETNATDEGRAHNRRVEVSRACGP